MDKIRDFEPEEPTADLLHQPTRLSQDDRQRHLPLLHDRRSAVSSARGRGPTNVTRPAIRFQRLPEDRRGRTRFMLYRKNRDGPGPDHLSGTGAGG